MQSGGNDVITDYAEEDKIQLVGTVTASTVDADILFTNDTGTILVKDGAGKTIDTILGGANNALSTADDELWGTDKAEIFVYDGGNDTIHGYAANDKIDLGDGYSLSDLVNGAPSTADNNLVFTFDKRNSLTLSDANNISTVTFTNGDTYSYDGKRYTKK